MLFFAIALGDKLLEYFLWLPTQLFMYRALPIEQPVVQTTSFFGGVEREK